MSKYLVFVRACTCEHPCDMCSRVNKRGGVLS